ncbi:hypothetical protein [Mycoplasmopsis edwardii]|nr:hypothetical protein [Mycoplasmopsis edwardii]
MNKKAKNVFKFAIPFVLLSTAASIPVITTLLTRSKQIGNQYTKKELDKNQVRKSLKNISKSINASAKQLNSLNFDYSEMVKFYTNKLSENELEISNFKIKKEVYLKHDELVNEVYNNLNFLTSEGINKINNDQIFIKFKNNFLLSNSDINDLKHKLNHWKNEVNPFIENLSKKLDELLLLYQNNETLINSLKNKENINLILSSIKNWNEFVLKSVENDDEVEAHLNEFIINLETFNTTINNFKLTNSYDSEFIINELNILEVTKDNLNKSIEIIKSNQNIIDQTILNANKNIKFYKSEINKIIDLLSKDINNFDDKYFNFNSYFNQYYKKMYNSYIETLMNIYKNKSVAVEVSTYINEIKSQLQKDYAANINTLNVTKDEEKLEKTLSFILNLN